MKYRIYHNQRKDWFAKAVASKPIVLLSICILVILVGLGLSLLRMDALAFPRSGSVLVVIAIISVYFNHYYSSEIMNINGLSEGLKNLNHQALANQMKSSNQEMSDEDALSNAVGVFSLLEKNKKRLPLLKTSCSNIVKVEFLAGVVGTIIWGFGDIPFT